MNKLSATHSIAEEVVYLIKEVILYDKDEKINQIKEVLTHNFLKAEIYLLIKDLIDESLKEKLFDMLWKFLQMTRKGSFLGTDAISLLNILDESLEGADLSQIYIEGAYLVNAKMSNIRLSRSDLIGANLKGADLRGAFIDYAFLSGANFDEANLNRADLTKSFVRSASLVRTKLNNAILSFSNFDQAFLREADLSDSYCLEAYFGEANLKKSNCSSADFENANFIEANLQGVTFQGASLQNANLQGANLQDANLENANLKGTNINKIQGISKDKIKKLISKGAIEISKGRTFNPFTGGFDFGEN